MSHRGGQLTFFRPAVANETPSPPGEPLAPLTVISGEFSKTGAGGRRETPSPPAEPLVPGELVAGGFARGGLRRLSRPICLGLPDGRL